MNSRKMFALFLVLALAGSALAVQQQRLYRSTSEFDVDPEARGVIAIQQHSVFVEIIVEQVVNQTQIHQFAAVVGLVKKCKQVRNVFDNAVLWFNDQFLFGNKSNVTVNVTPPGAMGVNPNRTIDLADLLDDNRNNGTGTYDPSTGGNTVDEVGTGPNEGGNPDRDGFIRAQDFRERWGGCFIPDGFVHAIGADDPYGVGKVASADAQVEEDVSPDRYEVGPTSVGLNNIAIAKTLIDLDNDCGGCLFEYVGTFYITDPNNHRWMVDKTVYPIDVAQTLLVGEDPTNCHIRLIGATCGLQAAERHADRNEDDGSYEGFESHCYDDVGECDADKSDPTDTRHQEAFKFTTKEPMFTVHLQVDPWNPDRQGFPDEAIWRYNDGTLRVGMPYTEDENHFCHDSATVAGATRVDTGLHEKADAYEYDQTPGETGGFDYNLSTAPGNGTGAWAEFRRGPVGNTVECAIEYNFLIAVDFEAFDNTPPISASQSVTRDDLNSIAPGSGQAGVWANASSQQEGEGENEIIRNAKHHGPGQADAGDQAWQGNSHPHNPQDQLDNTDCVTQTPDGPTDQPACPEKPHKHDAVSLDLFFYARAPYFIESNPYWDHANSTDALVTTGTPPVVDDQCVTAPNLPPSDYRRQAVEARVPMVCDVDAVDGFHLHDKHGSQIIP